MRCDGEVGCWTWGVEAKANGESGSTVLREHVGEVSDACKEAVESVREQSKDHD